MHPDVQRALADYNHAQYLFDNLRIDDDSDLVQSVMYQLNYEKKKLDDVINKYRFKEQENFS